MLSSDEIKRSVQKQVVIFRGIDECYQVGSDIICKYTVPANLEVTPNGWVGLFRVGWRSLSDYIYFDWATLPTEYVKGMAFDGKITFPANKLPNEDGEFYQFCYVTASKGDVRGASTPFQFRTCTDISNFDLIEVEDENEELLVVKTKTTLLEDKLKSAELAKQQIKKELELSESEKTTLKLDHRKMLNFLVTLNQEGESKDSKLQENMEIISELKTQNTELNERLTSIQDKIDVLNQEKSSMEKRLDDSDMYIVSLQEKIKNLVTDKEILHVKVKNLEEEREVYKMYMDRADELKTRLADEEMKNSQMHKEIERLEAEIEVQRVKILQQHNLQINDKENIESLTERLHNAEDKLSAAEVCKAMLNEEVITIKLTNERKLEELLTTKAATLKLLQDNDTRNETTIKALQKEISGLKKERMDMQQKYDEKIAEMNDLQINISENTKVEDGGSLFALQIAYDALTDTYKNSCKRVETLQKHNEQLKQSLNEVENFKNEQVREIEGLRQRLLMGKELYQDTYAECEKLRAQLARKSSLPKSSPVENEIDVTNKIRMLSSTNIDLVHKLSESEESLKMERDENERLKSSIVSLDIEVQRLLGIIADRVKMSNSHLVKEMTKSQLENIEKSCLEKIILEESFEDALDDAIDIEAEYESTIEEEAIDLKTTKFAKDISSIDFNEYIVTNNANINVGYVDRSAKTENSESLDLIDFLSKNEDYKIQNLANHKCPICEFPLLCDMTDREIDDHMKTHESLKVCPMCHIDYNEKSDDEFLAHVNDHFQ